MKVLTCWEIIQLLAESGEATGKTSLYHRQYQLVAISNMFLGNWHVSKIVRIKMKSSVNHE